MLTTTEARMQELQEIIKRHDTLYEQGNPVITDSEYDTIYKELVELEAENPELVSADSPTQRIAYVIVDGLKEVQHSRPMLSLQKVDTEETLTKFLSRRPTRILIQDKLDGLTVVRTYMDGKVVSDVTRGDGTTGEDVTHTVSTIHNLPNEIAYTGRLEVRMEVIIPFEEFLRINVDGKYSNPRNLAAGTTRQLKQEVAAKRGMEAIVFDLVDIDGKDFDTDSEQLAFLESLGLPVVKTHVFEADQIEDAVRFCTGYAETTRQQLPYMIDGLVIKFDDLALREELGETGKYPLWATAFKFGSQNATTVLRDVVFQVGKSGQITPVAVFDEVTIDAVNIRRATLHNMGNITTKDIRIGDTILVERAKDVIPQVVKSHPELRTGEETPVVFPENCPECGGETAYEGANLYCYSLDCESQLVGRIENFVSRDAMDIDGIGGQTVADLYEAGLVRTIPDLYRLPEQKEAFVALEGYGERSFEQLVKGLEKSKTNAFERVLYGFGVRLVGRTASKLLAKEFASIPEMMKAAEDVKAFEDRILAIEGIGEGIMERLVGFVKSDWGFRMVRELEELGLAMQSHYVAPATDTAISGKTFVITGKLSKDRNAFKADIEKLGGKVSGSVSKKTDYLLMGPDAFGTSKHTKATELGVVILDEETFVGIIG